MSHVPSVSKAAIEAAERKFRWFLALSLIVLGVIAFASMVGRESEFWRGNILWAWGSSLVAISVIQTRFVNIRKMANPRNVTIAVFGQPGFSKVWEVVETVVNLYWIVGFCFIVLSRWLNW